MALLRNERDFPVRSTWLFKPALRAVLSLPILLLFWFAQKRPDQGLEFLMAVLIAFNAAYFVTAWLHRATFHFSVDDKFLTVRQGVIKKQEKHLPYAVIQHIILKQDLMDRLFGIVTFALENATRGKDNIDGEQRIFGLRVNAQRRRQSVDSIGFQGNRLSIPGLRREDAEALRAVILGKIEENPLSDNQSGL